MAKKKTAPAPTVAPSPDAITAPKGITAQYLVEQIQQLQQDYAACLQKAQQVEIDAKKQAEQCIADANAKHGAIQAFNIMLTQLGAETVEPPAPPVAKTAKERQAEAKAEQLAKLRARRKK